MSLLLTTALAALGRPSAWRRPIGRDGAQYLYAGRVVADGGVPYRDVALNKGPLVFWLFAAVGKLAGTRAVAVRACLFPFELGSIAALRAWLAVLAPTDAPGAAIALALLCSATTLDGDEPNTEGLGTAPALLAVAAAERGAAATGGAALAAAVLINPALGFAALPAGVALARRRNSGAIIRFVAGLTIPLVLTAAGLNRVEALADARAQVLTPVRVNLDGARLQNFRYGRARNVPFLTDVPAPRLWLAGVVGLTVASLDPTRRGAALSAGSWTAAMWLRLKVDSYTFPHHAVPALPGLVAGIALGSGTLGAALGRPRLAAVACFAPLVIAEVALPQRRELARVPWERRGTSGRRADALAYPVAAFLNADSDPADLVYVANSDPAVLWLSGRRAPSRVFDVYPNRHHPAYGDEREQILRHSPPRYAVSMSVEDAADPQFQRLLSWFDWAPVFAQEETRVYRRR